MCRDIDKYSMKPNKNYGVYCDLLKTSIKHNKSFDEIINIINIYS